MSDGEHSLGDLMISKLRQKVGLVLQRVDGSGEEDGLGIPRLLFHSLGIMACGYAVEVLAALFLEGSELYHPVAHHVGIGSQAFADTVDGVAHHVVPILAMKVHLLETASIFLCNI